MSKHFNYFSQFSQYPVLIFYIMYVNIVLIQFANLRKGVFMKIRDGYILSSVAGKNIVVSVGSDVNFSGMLTLNDTGVFFWNLLKEGTAKEAMLEAVITEYDVDRKTASEDIDEFLTKLSDKGILED